MLILLNFCLLASEDVLGRSGTLAQGGSSGLETRPNGLFQRIDGYNPVRHFANVGKGALMGQ